MVDVVVVVVDDLDASSLLFWLDGAPLIKLGLQVDDWPVVVDSRGAWDCGSLSCPQVDDFINAWLAADEDDGFGFRVWVWVWV